MRCKRQFCVASADAEFYGKSRAEFGAFDNLLPKYNIVLGRIYRLFGCYFVTFCIIFCRFFAAFSPLQSGVFRVRFRGLFCDFLFAFLMVILVGFCVANSANSSENYTHFSGRLLGWEHRKKRKCTDRKADALSLICG